jgi:hypothetical protein
MNNIEFYVKYLENKPVPIDSHINNDRTSPRTFPIVTVAYLVAAAVTEPTRGLLGLPKEYGSLTLHSSQNAEPLAGNFLLSSLLPGTGAYETPLVIRDSVVSKLINLSHFYLFSLLEFWFRWFFDQFYFAGFLVAVSYAFSGNNIAAIAGPIVALFAFIYTCRDGKYPEVVHGWKCLSKKAWTMRPDVWIGGYAIVNSPVQNDHILVLNNLAPSSLLVSPSDTPSISSTDQ